MNSKSRRRKDGRNCHIRLPAIKQYLLHGCYPAGCSQIDKRSIRKRAETFKICDDDLYYIARPKRLDDEQPDPNPGADRNNYRKVVLTGREQLVLTTRIHVGDTGVHKGVERTLHALTSQYYWVGMSTTVRQVIKSCVVCLANRQPNSHFRSIFQTQVIPNLSNNQPSNESDEAKPTNDGKENFAEGDVVDNKNELSYTITAELPNPEEEDPDLDCNTSNVFNDDNGLMMQSEIPNAQQFWERVEIQIISPSEENKRNKPEYGSGRYEKKSYVIVALDSFSKWPEAKKLDKVNEQTVSQFIIQLIARFGIMNQIVFLENDIMWENSLVLSGILQNLSTFNVIVMSESLNAFDQHWTHICMNICNFVGRYSGSWSSCLDLCLMPLRNSVSLKMDYSPAFLLMGREPVFPSFILPPKDSASSEVMLNQDQIESAIDSIMGKFQECCEADVKRVISPLESIPLNVKRSSVKEELTGVRRSGRKVTLSHRLIDFEDVISPVSAHENSDSFVDGFNDGDYNVMTKGEEGMVQSVPLKKRKHPSTGNVAISQNASYFHQSARVTVSRKRSNGEEDLDKMDISTFYEIIRLYIEQGTYPLNSPVTFKRIVRKAREMYCIEDGKLMYTHKNKTKVLPMTMQERLEIMNEIHTSTADHVPKLRMLEEIESRNITWRAVGSDVEAYIKACPDCRHGVVKTRVKKRLKKKWEGDSDSDEDGTSLDEKFPTGISSYSDLIDYLNSGSLPCHLPRAALVVFKKKAKSFKLLEGELHYHTCKSKLKPRKVLLTEEERLDAMRKVHGDSHHAPNLMMLELRKQYYWRPMAPDVERFVGDCCQPDIDRFKERRDDELRNRIDLFQRHFQGEDICGPTVDVDSIFPGTGEDDEPAMTSETTPAALSESLDDQTGLLIKRGQEDFDEDVTITGNSKHTMIIELNNDASADLEACIKQNDSNDEDGITEEETSGEVASSMVVELKQNGEKNIGNISEKENPYGHVKKRGLKSRCDVCHMIIRGENKFKEHMYRHTGIKPFICQVCSKKFTTVKGMRLHMRKHTGHRPYLCNICGRGFPRSASLRYHIKSHDKTTVPAVCDVCNRVFTSEHRLKKHKLFKHPSKSLVFKCETCGKHFTAKRSLKRHEEAHQGIRRYMCPFCKRSFFRKEYLTYHLDSHYKNNPAMSHLASKRKFRRRANQKPQSVKEENTNILSILTVEPDMGQEEVYTQLVEVTHPQGWSEGTTQVNEGHAIPAVFNLDGTLQVSEVVDHVDTGTPITIVEESTATSSDQAMEIHHIIMPSSQIDLNQPSPNSHQEMQLDNQHDTNQQEQTAELHHEQHADLASQNSRHIQVTLTNGQKLTLARADGNSFGDQNQETIQYHVECLSGETLTEADLNAIRMLAQSSVLQQ